MASSHSAAVALVSSRRLIAFEPSRITGARHSSLFLRWRPSSRRRSRSAATRRSTSSSRAISAIRASILAVRAASRSCCSLRMRAIELSGRTAGSSNGLRIFLAANDEGDGDDGVDEDGDATACRVFRVEITVIRAPEHSQRGVIEAACLLFFALLLFSGRQAVRSASSACAASTMASALTRASRRRSARLMFFKFGARGVGSRRSLRSFGEQTRSTIAVRSQNGLREPCDENDVEMARLQKCLSELRR